ncbi:MAG: signal peptidase I [Myxococcaceae bacterium]|nr:signal peptidase I [Myxococcaceae bacterium]
MDSARQKKPSKRWMRYLADLAFLAIILVGRGSFADHYHVPSGSMEPTLQVGDRLAVDKSAYGLRIPLTHVWLTEAAPRRGDVIVFDSPVDGTVLVKRLVGLPGDRIAFDGVHLYLNGQRVPQSFTLEDARIEHLPGAPHPLHPEPEQGPPMREVEVPPRHYLVLGDHRGNSADSRAWGFVPRQNLLGRAVAIAYSPREGLSPGERWWIPLRPTEDTPSDPRLTR